MPGILVGYSYRSVAKEGRQFCAPSIATNGSAKVFSIRLQTSPSIFHEGNSLQGRMFR
jgi:hypothetical protein